jgi:hypothetical protein
MADAAIETLGSRKQQEGQRREVRAHRNHTCRTTLVGADIERIFKIRRRFGFGFIKKLLPF